MSKTKWLIPQIPLPDENGNTILSGYYTNVGEVGIAVVAVISWWKQGDSWHLFDWAAYIGGSVRGAQKEEWAIADAVKSGNKLSIKDAKHFFPYLPILRYRE